MLDGRDSARETMQRIHAANKTAARKSNATLLVQRAVATKQSRAIECHAIARVADALEMETWNGNE